MNPLFYHLTSLILWMLSLYPLSGFNGQRVNSTNLVSKRLDIKKPKVKNIQILYSFKNYLIILIVCFLIFIIFNVFSFSYMNVYTNKAYFIGNIAFISIASFADIIIFIYIISSLIIAYKEKKNISNYDWIINFKEVNSVINKINEIQIVHTKKKDKYKIGKKINSLLEKYNVNNKYDQILLFFSIYELVYKYFDTLEYKGFQIEIDNKTIDLYSCEDEIFEKLNNAILFD